MSSEKTNGFLRGVKARHAEEAIGHSEGLVTVLRLTSVDLEPAEDAIRIAKDLFAAEHYTKAVAAARQAEALAITLDERNSGYQKARAGLEAVAAGLQRIGLPSESFEATLGRAEEKVAARTWENGSFVPNYLEARVLLESAELEGRALLEKAASASNAIFLAELSLEALVDVQGPVDPKTFGEGAAVGLDQALEEATRQVALGDLDAAIRVAQDLEDRARRLRSDYIEASRVLTAAEVQLGDLRGEGIATERIESQVELARDVLARGMIDSGMTLARQIAMQASSLGETYRKATTGLQDAEILYAQLNREGFHSYEAERALRDARKSVREGAYARSLELLQRAHEAFLRRQNAREALGRAIKETGARVKMLQGSGIAFMDDVQELLGRAEREFRDGNYSGSSEDLRIATLLLGSAEKHPAGAR